MYEIIYDLRDGARRRRRVRDDGQMSVRRLGIGVLVAALLAAALAGCVAPPAPTPTDDGVCDPLLLTGSLNGDLTATATALDDLGFPLDGVAESGVTPDCTARLSVVDAEGTALELDVALVNVPRDDLSILLDELTAPEGWVRDPVEPIWRETDGGRSLLALEIEEGMLLCLADPGEVPPAWLPHD
jgi:hypothetical protein